MAIKNTLNYNLLEHIMPIDDDIIDSTLKGMIDKITQNHTARGNLQKLHDLGQSIKLVTVPDPTEKEPRRTKKVIPNDPMLGGEMSETRRQAIYDKFIADVNLL